jgi:hypothetical protein
MIHLHVLHVILHYCCKLKEGFVFKIALIFFINLMVFACNVQNGVQIVSMTLIALSVLLDIYSMEDVRLYVQMVLTKIIKILLVKIV